MKREDYKSIGQMLKKSDFTALNEELDEMVKNESIKNFSKTTKENPISELDDLIFYYPKYCLDKNNNILEGAEEFLNKALSLGANPNAYMKNGENMVLKACESPNVKVLENLINNQHIKIDLTHTDGMGNNCLFYAVMSENTTIIEYLVKNCNFNINEKNFLSNDQTVLHYACGHGKEKSIEKLIELGGDLTIKDHFGYQPYEMMIIGYDEETQEEYEDEPETVEKWKSLYEKYKNLTEVKIQEAPKKMKKIFN